MSDKQINEKISRDQIVDCDISQELKDCYLDYAMSVIVSRAIPDCRDGLKPVQRRILYSMKELGLGPTTKFKKSALVVGHAMGRYHPHGDMAIYDTLVRMAQDFSLRYMLVNGQGNFGCFTGDTKIKLTDGRDLSFLDLIREQKQGKKHWGFAFNTKEKKVVITEILKPRKTSENQELVEITLDNDEKIKCTLNHKFMVRNGTYIEAQYLKEGDPLMPLYIDKYAGNDKNLKEYEIVMQPITGEWDFIHQLADEWNLDRCTKEKTTTTINHKVKKIQFLKEYQDVYDITTTPWHNFALASGVFVHNSIDGDPAAASRYTESRMRQIADDMFVDIEKETIDFVPNYDNTLKQPKVLPTKVPQLLLNGTTGIAVGMATNIPPHNLTEIMDALIYTVDNPDCDTDDLMKFVKGPDFPTGGTIYGWDTLKEAYATGKGKVLVRGNVEIVDNGKASQIVITEIPYMVNKAELIKKIAHLIEEKKIINIKDIRDESDKKGLTITIDLKKDANAKSIVNQLFKYTDLEKYFHINAIALVEDGLQPQLLSLKDILVEFISFRKTVVARRTHFLLRKAKERLHILEGLKTALDHIDEIIEIIKKSENKEDANLKLCKRFKFTEIQANVILETKLQAIANLEKMKILNELKEKQGLIDEYESILKDEKRIVKIIKEEFSEIKEKHGDERRTKAIKSLPDKINEQDLIPEEDVLITLSQSGYIKRMNANVLRTQQRGGKGITAYNSGEDDCLEHILTINTKDNMLFFSDKGKVYQALAYDINDASREAKGKAIQNFIDISSEEKITVILGHNPSKDKSSQYLLMATKNGVIKKTSLDEFSSIRKNGLLSIKLEKDDLLEWASFTTGDDLICLTTKQGQSITFSEKDVRPMGRASSGVTGIKLSKDDEVVGMIVIPKTLIKSNAAIISISELGFGKKTLIKEYRIQKRGGTGIKTFKITPKTGLLVTSKLANEEQVLISISKKGLILKTELSDVPILSRTTQGVKIMRIDSGDKVSEISII